jgi:signal peptidase I
MGTAPILSDVIAAGLERDGRVMTLFSGRSMQPTLREGMRLLVEKIPPEDVNPCDIIMYREGDSLVAHRVIGKTRKDNAPVFITKGDNHAYIDPVYVPYKDLMGIVRSAFAADDPGKDILIKSRLTGLMYLGLSNMSLAVRNRRLKVPKILRDILKCFVGGFFFICKKFIHTVYMVIYHVRLFNRRPASRS